MLNLCFCKENYSYKMKIIQSFSQENERLSVFIFAESPRGYRYTWITRQ